MADAKALPVYSDFPSTVDFARAAALMDVVQKASSVCPQYTSLSSEAMAELKEMNDLALKEGKERHAQVAKVEADNAAIEARRVHEEQAKIAAEDKARADAAAKVIPTTEIEAKANADAANKAAEAKKYEDAAEDDRPASNKGTAKPVVERRI